MICSRCRREFHPVDLLEGVDGLAYCSNCSATLYENCIKCGELILKGDARKPDGEEDCYCPDCFEESFRYCLHCDKSIPKDKIVIPEGNYETEEYCEPCYEELFASCSDCDISLKISEDDLFCDENGEPFCGECYGNRYTECQGCGTEINRDNDLDDYCETCHETRRVTCRDCGEDVHITDAIHLNGDWHCNPCFIILRQTVLEIMGTQDLSLEQEFFSRAVRLHLSP